MIGAILSLPTVSLQTQDSNKFEEIKEKYTKLTVRLAVILLIIPFFSSAQSWEDPIHYSVKDGQVKIKNEYGEALSVSIGEPGSYRTDWAQVYSGYSVAIDYKLKKRSFYHTFIYFRYDAQAFNLFLAEKEAKLSRKIHWSVFRDALIKGCEGEGVVDLFACIEKMLSLYNQTSLHNVALMKIREYTDLLSAVTDSDKQKCLIDAISFIAGSVEAGFPSVGLEISGYVLNVIKGTEFYVPISNQIVMYSQMKSQLEIGRLNARYTFKDIPPGHQHASYGTRFPIVVNFNYFLNQRKNVNKWTSTYATIGYAQSTLMYNRNYDSLFQIQKGIAYNHTSIGLGYIPTIHYNSNVLFSFDLDLTYRLNFRKEFQINFPDTTSNRVMKNASEYKGLEGAGIFMGIGLILGYRNCMLKAKIHGMISHNTTDKNTLYPLSKYYFGTITFSMPLFTRNVFLYRR